MYKDKIVQALIIVPSGCLNKKTTREAYLLDLLNQLNIKLNFPYYKVAKGGIKRGHLNETALDLERNILSDTRSAITIVDGINDFIKHVQNSTLKTFTTFGKLKDINYFIEEVSRDDWEKRQGELISPHHPEYYSLHNNNRG